MSSNSYCCSGNHPVPAEVGLRFAVEHTAVCTGHGNRFPAAISDRARKSIAAVLWVRFAVINGMYSLENRVFAVAFSFYILSIRLTIDDKNWQRRRRSQTARKCTVVSDQYIISLLSNSAMILLFTIPGLGRTYFGRCHWFCSAKTSQTDSIHSSRQPILFTKQQTRDSKNTLR